IVGKISEQVKLFGREIKQLISKNRFAIDKIQNHASHDKAPFGAPRSQPTKDGAYTGHHFPGVERFDDIIVGAPLQADNAIDIIPTSRHKNNRNVGDFAKLVSHAMAVGIWELQIEEHD